MMRLLNLGLVLTGLAMLALPVRGQDAVAPLPDRNPARLEQPASTGTAVPLPEEKPNLPGDQATLPWQSPKVNAALSACAKMLEGVTIDYEQLPPIKHGLCGAPAPILVTSIGAEPAVVIEPPATVTCALAAKLDAWLKDKVQPAAAALGSAVVKIRNASSYKCRNRYGEADTKISEHALANALDISEFVLASGERVTVLDSWPRPAAAAPLPPLPDPKPARDAEIAVTKVKAEPAAPPEAPAVATPPVASPPAETSPAERKSAFVHNMHAEACKTFNTVLGPAANEAHKDHFHLDMKVRRYVKICE